MKKLAIILVLLTFLHSAGVGTTGANYLKIGLGAKATAMGENFTAMADDSSAVYWNPAGITKAKGNRLDYMQINWVAGISSKTFSGVYPLNDTDYIGGYLFMLDTPEDTETQYDASAGGQNAYVETGDKFSSSVKVFDIAYSKKIMKKLSMGLGLKSVHENLAGDEASGFALDFGLIYEDLFPNLSLGAAMQNMTISKLRTNEELPMNLSFGLAYDTEFMGRKTTLLSDIKMPNDNDLRFGVGCEYWIAEMLAGRFGYNSYYGFSFGVGLTMESIVADYAYVPLNEDLGVTHRISVGYKFNAADEKEDEDLQNAIVNTSEVASIDDFFNDTSAETKTKEIIEVEKQEIQITPDNVEDVFGELDDVQDTISEEKAVDNTSDLGDDLFAEDVVAKTEMPLLESAVAQEVAQTAPVVQKTVVKDEITLVKKNIIAGADKIKCYYKYMNNGGQVATLKAEVTLMDAQGNIKEIRNSESVEVAPLSEVLLYQSVGNPLLQGDFQVKAEILVNGEKSFELNDKITK